PAAARALTSTAPELYLGHQLSTRGMARNLGGPAMIDPSPSPQAEATASLNLVDCDLHNNVPHVRELFPYLPSHWREHIEQTLFKGPVDNIYPRNAPITARPGSVPEGGSVASPNVDVLRAQVLDPVGVDVGILCCSYAVDSLHHPDAAVALAR